MSLADRGRLLGYVVPNVLLGADACLGGADAAQARLTSNLAKDGDVKMEVSMLGEFEQ